MEEDIVDGEDLTPFWLQTTVDLRRTDRLRRGFSAVFFSSGLVVLLLLVTAVSFLVFVVPSTLSFSVNIFRPNSVKKSWDSLNIVLVLVAVVFGFLSRNKNQERSLYYDEYQGSSIQEDEPTKLNPSTPIKWYESSDHEDKFEQKNLILRRNGSSYPDLREVSSTYWSYGDYQRRFYDDIHVDSGRVSDPGHLLRHRRHRSMEQVDYLREIPQTKTVIVDTLVRKSKEDTNPPILTLSPPQAAATAPVEIEELLKDINENAVSGKEKSRRKLSKDFEHSNLISAPKPPLPSAEESQAAEIQDNPRRTYERVARKKERSSRKQIRAMEETNPITAPPQIPPPPPPPEKQRSSKSDRKIGGATGSATKDFLNSLYHKKKKKPRQKSVDNMDSLLHEAQPPLSFQIPPPSPPPPPPPPLSFKIPPPSPPPPPPPSVFRTLFSSKKHKRKRTITVTLEPYPPPPPPRGAVPELKPTFHTVGVTTQKPPKPIKISSFEKVDETSNSGGESPLNRIPPPPPPPPPSFLKSAGWKFVVQGDYVRINSNNSSRSGSPEPYDTDSDVTPSAAGGGDAAAFQMSPLFCPSPDVNTKAESFITNFRAKLKLEKVHSMKKRELGLSSLGRGSGLSSLGRGSGPTQN